MYVEERMYTLHIAKAAEYFQLYEKEGRDVQLRILGCNVGYYVTEVGPQNLVVHLWAYRSLDDRALRRDRLQADPVWKEYVAKIRPLIVNQDTRIMKPAPFMVKWLESQLPPA